MFYLLSLTALIRINRSIVDVSSMIIFNWSKNMIAQNRVNMPHRSKTMTARIMSPPSNVVHLSSAEQLMAYIATLTKVQPAVTMV
jgi:hypothetical protein